MKIPDETGLMRKRPGNAEPEVAEQKQGADPAAVRRLEVRRFVDPGTASQDALVAFASTRPCAAITRRTAVAIMPTILYPLP